VAVLSLATLSLNAADTVTNGQTVARARLVQQVESAGDVAIAVAPAGTNITYAWELWNVGTNTVSVTNGITGTNVVLAAGEFTALRAIATNAWRVIYGKGISP